MGHLVQMAGLAVRNFASAAVGIAVALVRAFARRGIDRSGNFWVDLTRILLAVPAGMGTRRQFQFWEGEPGHIRVVAVLTIVTDGHI
jgi:hypothetical protein